MNVLIVEDEELAAEKIMDLVTQIDASLRIVGLTASVQASVEWLQNHAAPDLILMDIELADGQSFAIFEQIDVDSPVIFTTSYDEYAIRAFKVNSIDYLLKPIRRQDLEASLNKHKKLLSAGSGRESKVAISELAQQLREQIQPVEYRRRFLVRHLSQWIPVEVSDIAYFYSEDGISLFRTVKGQKYPIDYTLDDLETMIDPSQFFRANRQYIIHISSVVKIHQYFNYKLKLILQPAADGEVLVSRDRSGEFKKWMGK
ncbi:LytR/AlgR family response regulator transcription factor [Spirosoma fluminis]